MYSEDLILNSFLSELKIADVVSTSVQLKWDPPKDQGDCELIGYQVEKRDAKSPADEWYVCVDKVRHSNVQVRYLSQIFLSSLASCSSINIFLSITTMLAITQHVSIPFLCPNLTFCVSVL